MTTPATPVLSTDTAIITRLKADWTWLVSHLIILAFVALLVGGAVYEVDSIIARHDAVASSKASALYEKQFAQTQTLLQQLRTDQAASLARDAQYQAEIVQLSKSIQVRDANVKKQQQTDSTLDAVSAGARLAQQTNAQAGQVTVANDLVTIDLPLTRGIVADLDLLVATKADLQDTQTQLTAQTGLTTDAKAQLVDANKVIGAQKIELVDSANVCKAQIKVLKANQRKKLMKVGVVGFVAGFISGVTAHLW